MRLFGRRTFQLAGLFGWGASLLIGVSLMWAYESTAGRAANSPTDWPAQTNLSRSKTLPTLVLFAHPHCPCSRATIEELSKLMAHCQNKVTTTVVMMRPASVAAGWEHTGLWNSAAAIPGVRVVVDGDGAEARRFGAATSGQAMLYSATGRLLFTGGITESRGHSGDNAGSSAIVSFINKQSADTSNTPVYGCPLFEDSTCKGENICRK